MSRSHEGTNRGMGGSANGNSDGDRYGKSGISSSGLEIHSHRGSATEDDLRLRPKRASKREPRCSESAPRQEPSSPCVGSGRPSHQHERRRCHSSSHDEPSRCALASAWPADSEDERRRRPPGIPPPPNGSVYLRGGGVMGVGVWVCVRGWVGLGRVCVCVCVCVRCVCQVRV